MCFGSMMRDLYGVWPNKAEAEAAMSKKLEESPFYEPSYFFVEEVDVTMRDWTP